MSDQTGLLNAVALVRELLDGPTNLSPAQLKACRAVAEKTADACYFNAGWHMAQGKATK